VPTDPEFVIPVASSAFSAVASEPAVSQDGPVVVQVTGVRANNEGIYPTSTITVHVGATSDSCHPNPFGECLITVSNPPIGLDSIYATYTGYGSRINRRLHTSRSNRDVGITGCQIHVATNGTLRASQTGDTGSISVSRSRWCQDKRDNAASETS